MKELENKFAELHRRVSSTSKARYCASRRLLFHNVMSQWTVTLITVGLIAVSVLAISPVKLNFAPPYVAVMQIIFSVLILAYSLLLSLGDYSARAVKIHRCGMELGKVARELKPFLEASGEDTRYTEFVEKYYECLEKYENHESCDYLEASLSEWELLNGVSSVLPMLQHYAHYTLTLGKYLWTKYLPAAHYFVVLGMVYIWIFYLVA